ncbi:MAG: RecX family transcriptional regulator [Ruminococcus sp.]|nr:RecX family transcriptional regulator [Ruminococcus sp.]
MMKIESIEKYKGRTKKIEFEEGEAAFLNEDIVARYNLKAGVSVPEEAWEEIVHADTYRRARERAMYLLDYRDYSYNELVKKLNDNYDDEICVDVAEDLVERGFIDDRRYAEQLARRECEVKLYGSYRARHKLREKGISDDLIVEVLKPYEEDAVQRAMSLIDKKLLKYYEPQDKAQMQKLKAALARYGYSFDVIKEAVEAFGEMD